MPKSIEHPVCDCQYCLKKRRDSYAMDIYTSFATSERRSDVAVKYPRELAAIAFDWADAFIAEADKPKPDSNTRPNGPKMKDLCPHGNLPPDPDCGCGV
jgi:hypothetical protein